MIPSIVVFLIATSGPRDLLRMRTVGDTVIMIRGRNSNLRLNDSSLSAQYNRTSLAASGAAPAEIRRFVFRASYESAHAQ